MRQLSSFIVSVLAVAGVSQAFAQSLDSDSESIVNQPSFSSRVLGGGDAEPGAYPSIVALVNPDVSPTEQRGPLDSRLFCGGTVVAETWVLTAAHCLYDGLGAPLLPDAVRVVGSVTDLASETAPVEVPVVQVIIHPDYDNTLQGLPPNDIALLELEMPIEAQVVPLFAGYSGDYIDGLGIIAGWGAVDISQPFNEVYPTVLQDAVVPLVSDEKCNGPESYDGNIVKSHLCAGYDEGEVDACYGDSGGPLYMTINGIQTQVAITSFGIECGLPMFYGIYTEVSYFIPWLGQYIAVPEQSAELLAKLAAEDNPYYTGGSGSETGKSKYSIGSLNWMGLMFLVMAILRRAYHPIRS